MKIGAFHKTQDGALTGRIQTLTLDIAAELHPITQVSDNAPSYRAIAVNADNGAKIEIGAGWKKTSQAGNDYLSLELDDPSLTGPIYSRLTADAENGGFTLWWDRLKAKPAPNSSSL